MNQETKILFENLSTELSLLYARWKIYIQLYGTNPEDLDLINEMSPNFFRFIQDTLTDDIILGLCRFMDPISYRNRNEIRENLSFNNLFNKIKPLINSDGEIRLNKILDQLDSTTEEMRTQRNRRITHLDLLTKTKVDQIPSVTREMAEKALELSSQFLNTVAELQGEIQKGYEHIVLSDSGKTIIHYLRMAKAYDVHWRNLDVDPYKDGVYKK